MAQRHLGLSSLTLGQALASAAERMKRYRERRRCGLRVVPVEVSEETIEALINAGRLSEDDVVDQGKLSEELGGLLDGVAS